jgi:LacI family transcriptional regulator, repressor for deo operon, udp, cdd, tsx, nupC, and nupG
MRMSRSAMRAMTGVRAWVRPMPMWCSLLAGLRDGRGGSVAVATLLDVATRAGVSHRTVSNVVNGYAPVTEKTRAKVQRVLDELGYRPNVLARNLARGRSGQLAVVVPYLDTPYFAELLQGVISYARAHGYNVLIDQTDGDPARERELTS